MANVFVSAQRPSLIATPAQSAPADSVDLLNRTNPETIEALERAYGKEITNDAELAEAKEAYFEQMETSIQEYQAATQPATPDAETALTPDEELQRQLQQVQETKSFYDKVMQGCTAKPFGEICTFCTTFPNETAYIVQLNQLINKLANEIAFRKVWKDALGLGDFDFIKKLGLCILNITRAGTAAINVAGMAYAAAGNAQTAEALAYVVLQRGGWMEPAEFINGMVRAMDATLENATATGNICTYFGYSGQDLYSSLVPVLGNDVRAIDLPKASVLTQKSAEVADQLMSQENRKVSQALLDLI